MEVLGKGTEQRPLETFQSTVAVPPVSTAMLISSLKMQLMDAKTSSPCSCKKLGGGDCSDTLSLLNKLYKS